MNAHPVDREAADATLSASAGTLRPLLEEFRRRHDVPAVAAALTTRDGLVEADVVGVRSRDGDEQATLADRWHIGSCGKSMTAALYARLVERGEAAWGARIPELFPDLATELDPGWTEITVDQLFYSRAGLPANLRRRQMLAAFRDDRSIVEQRTEAAARAFRPPPRRPGRFLYSNLGYILIGAAIERLTGQPYENALATHVLEPLSIASAGFGPPPGLWGHRGRMLQLGPLGLVDLGRGAPADPGRGESDNPPIMSPAGRLHLTLEDWSRFHTVFLRDGGDFLRPESIARLLTSAPGRGYRQAMGWAPVPPRLGASVIQQGSNTFWVATAVVDRTRERTAMVVCNEGRGRLLRRTPRLAIRLLSEGGP